MAGISFRTAGIVALLAAALYQTFLRDIVTRLGVGRTLQPISDFPYACRQLDHDELEACEDMWLDEQNRHLYLACSSVKSRQTWLPNMHKLNESASSAYARDMIYVLDIDKLDSSGKGSRYRSRYFQALAMPGFHGTAGEGRLHTLSVTGRRVHGGGRAKIELYLVNNKPSMSASSVTADNSQTGANSTVELFELEPGSSSMQHIRTFAHPLIATPNNVAPVPDGSGFYITNDHGLHKTGLQHSLSPYLFTGNVVYCTNPPRTSSTHSTCKVVATGLSFPNGLAIHPLDPKTLYVPSAAIGKGVAIFKIHPDGSLTKLTDLVAPYPMDNLSPSSDGSIYAAAFGKILETLPYFDDEKTFERPDPKAAKKDTKKLPPATVLKIDKIRNLVNDGREVTWAWEKVLEDGGGEFLPITTTALRDAKTGRFFMSGK